MSAFWNPRSPGLSIPQAVEWEVVAHVKAARLQWLVAPDLMNAVLIGQRHLDENDRDKCLKSRLQAARFHEWNRPNRPWPVSSTELNWQTGGRWLRCYDEFEDGFHRVEAAIRERSEAIWVEVFEYKFAPFGARPLDRRTV